MMPVTLNPGDHIRLRGHGVGNPESPDFLKLQNNINNQATIGPQLTLPAVHSTAAKPDMEMQSPKPEEDKQEGSGFNTDDALGVTIDNNDDNGMAGKDSDEGILGGEHGENSVTKKTENGNDDDEDFGRSRPANHEGGETDYDDIGDAQRHESPDHEVDYDRKNFKCNPVSSKHHEFIQQNLGKLQQQCKQFSECTEELYSASNYHLILAGENARLSNICGLMYANGGGQYTTLNEKCTDRERQAIRQTIGRKLSEQLAERSRDPTWKRLEACTKTHKKGNEKAIDTVCRLRKNMSDRQYLCDDLDVNTQTRIFFNEKLDTLHCSCVAVKAASAGKSGIPWFRFVIGGSVVCILLILVIAVIVLCLRHRKTNRKLKEHKIRYATSAAKEESSVTIYQEIHDVARAPKPPPARQDQDRKLLPQGYQLDVAPTVPERYVRGLNRPRATIPRPPGGDDDRPHSYLEPLADPLPGRSAQGGPPVKDRTPGSPYSLAKPVDGLQSSTPYSLAKHVESHPNTSPSGGYSLAKRVEESSGFKAGSESEAGTYFDTIRLQRDTAEDEFGYSKLRGSASGNNTLPPVDRESSAAGDPQYFELEAETETAEHTGNAENAPTPSTRL